MLANPPIVSNTWLPIHRHGSVPDIYGKNIASSVGMIWPGAMMLDFLGHSQGKYRQAHDAILETLEQAIERSVCTPNLGGNVSTAEMGQSIEALLS